MAEPSRPRNPARALASMGALLLCAPAALAQPALSLADLSLEQLSAIEVTSVGKRVQRLADVPGSVYVIYQEDIRRSGAVTLPEVLRLAPNLQVARADANQYAISARAFNTVLANKMLVLVDGRTVYSPLFSGVFWETVDTLLEDIERIEVLSGSGGTLYGSNAVNGVINIITRNAAETTGTVVKVQGGPRENTVAARYGAASPGGLHWRAYAKRYETDNTELASGVPVRDGSRRLQAGFRADRVLGPEQWTLQGDVYEQKADQAPDGRRVRGGNLLARWSRDGAPGVRTQLQAYLDRASRDQPGTIQDTLDTFDVEFQQSRRPGEGHELLWGGGYRHQVDDTVNIAPAVVMLRPERKRLHIGNLFVQNEFAATPSLRFTAGLKAEHNAYTGLEWLPSVKLAWQPGPEQLLWAAASRAVRTPARIDRDLIAATLPAGGANMDAEVARVFELGYRAQPKPALSYSLTLFHHDFSRLRSVDVLPAGLGFSNSYEGRLTGLEGWGRWRIGDDWRLQAGFVHQRLRLAQTPGTTAIPNGTSQLGNDPRTRFNLGVSWDVATNMELDLQARHVGGLPQPAVPSYTAVDLRWGWRVRPDLELSLSVRNLGDGRHPEWGSPATRAEIERSVLLKAVWRR